MLLDEEFVFSANNLQDYVDCPRRFELKYILHQSWPAVISKPVQALEEKTEMGTRFHRLAHQYLEGIPPDLLLEAALDQKVSSWFSRFIDFLRSFKNKAFISEFSVVSVLENFRLMAVIDFIAITQDESVIITDWKTTEIEPELEFYEGKIQTLLYPVIVFETLHSIFPLSDRIPPENVSLLYWFPAFPEKSLNFAFSDEIYSSHKNYLSSIIREISQLHQGAFRKTEDLKRCKFCQYRSLCERGIDAGNMDNIAETELEGLIENLSFDESEEISY